MKNLKQASLPPQDLDVEEAVLGTLLLERSSYNKVSSSLSMDLFYKEEHQCIYKAIAELHSEDRDVDIITVTNLLRKHKTLDLAGGAHNVTRLTSRISSGLHIEQHTLILVEKSILRKLIGFSIPIANKCYDGDADPISIIQSLQKELDIITNSIEAGRPADSILTIAKEVMIDVAKNMTLPQGGITGVPSGFTDIDKITGGWQNSDLIIIAARPAMGKTAYIASNVVNSAKDFAKSIAFFSLEMTKKQIVTRMITQVLDQYDISTDRLQRGRITTEEYAYINQSINKLVTSSIFIDDTPSLSIMDLRAKCWKLKNKNNIDMIVVDYLQLMTAGKAFHGNREQEISYISRQLKTLAKDLDIPVIALSQLSRSVESRADKRPMLSDLRESGAIEQDADIVCFIYRPEYYGIMEDESGNSLEGLGVFIIAKHRSGSLDDVLLSFAKKQTKFSDHQKYPTPPETMSVHSYTNFSKPHTEAPY